MTLGLSLVTSFAIAQAPYADMQSRPVKALSDKDVADLKAGRAWDWHFPPN